jgi:hypothetical protein
MLCFFLKNEGLRGQDTGKHMPSVSCFSNTLKEAEKEVVKSNHLHFFGA